MFSHAGSKVSRTTGSAQVKTTTIRFRPRFLWVRYAKHPVHRVIFPVQPGLRIVRALCGAKIPAGDAKFTQAQEKPKGKACPGCRKAWVSVLQPAQRAPREKFAVFHGKNVSHRIKRWFSSKIETRCSLIFNSGNATFSPHIQKSTRLCSFCRQRVDISSATKALVRDRERSHEAAAVGPAAVTSFQGPSQA